MNEIVVSSMVGSGLGTEAGGGGGGGVGGDGECEQEFMSGNLQNAAKCEAFHGGDLCEWACDSEPVDDSCCSGTPDIAVECADPVNNLATLTDCEAFESGGSPLGCRWLCPPEEPVDSCCLGSDECAQEFMSGNLQNAPDCANAFHGGEMCHWACDYEYDDADECDDSTSWVSTKGKTCDDVFQKNEKKSWEKKKAKQNCKKYVSDDDPPVKAKAACACDACDKSRFKKKAKSQTTNTGSVDIVVTVSIAAVLLVGAAAVMMMKGKNAIAQRRLSHRPQSMPSVVSGVSILKG